MAVMANINSVIINIGWTIDSHILWVIVTIICTSNLHINALMTGDHLNNMCSEREKESEKLRKVRLCLNLLSKYWQKSSEF